MQGASPAAGSSDHFSNKTSLRAIRYLLPLLTLNFATLTLAGIVEPITNKDIIALAVCMFAAVLLQLMIIEGLARWTTSLIPPLLLAAAFTCFNLYTTNLIVAEDFLELRLRYRAIIFFAAALLFLSFFMLASRKLVFLKLGSALVALLIVANLASFALNKAPNNSSEEQSRQATTEGTVSPKIRKVKFSRTPNVYLIGWESAAPTAVLQKYLGLANAPLEQTMIELGLRMFSNVFSEGSATRPSWNALMAMDQEYANSILGRSKQLIFAGAAPSPLIEIFKHNAYEVTTAYTTGYLGGNIKGPYIDNYILEKDFSPCDQPFVDWDKRAWFFFGACDFIQSKIMNSDAGTKPTLVDLIKKRIIEGGSARKPQLLMVHTSTPMHTNSEWKGSPEQLNDFKNRYLSASNQAASLLRELYSAIRSSGADSLILMFGDHGVWASRHIEFAVDPVFVVQDRFAVLAGIWPATACAETYDAQAKEPYRTTPQLVRLLITCLANGEDPYIGPYDHRINWQGTDIDLKDYIYE